MKRILGAALAAVVTAALLTFAPQVTQSASAADASQFDAGNIISDALFFDPNAMTATAIQAFLTAKEAGCHSSYACMYSYAQATPAVAARTGLCSALSPSTNMAAADIIFTVGAACGISQKALLVLLQKEQGLVTATNPSSTAFARATGFACPDSTGCDPAFGGFFYQVYDAARQFKMYAANPTGYNFQPGRVNNILQSPNCTVTNPVFIQNQATAGLYDYTPYTPNAAAMANLYGTGDSCSSYGNRNFWRYYTDWFGATTLGTSLIEVNGTSTVFLVSGTVKYPIPTQAILNALFPLGQIAGVSQSFADGYTTGHPVGRSLRAPSGTIYFYDAGIILPFSSCAQAVDYGASCDPTGFVQLTAAQIASFYPGPPVGPVLGTSSGSRYWITGGTKREILDGASQSAAGLPTSMNVLTDNAVADLPYGAPVTRDSVFIRSRGTSTVDYLQSNALYGLSADPASIGATSRIAGSLSAASLALIPAGTGSLGTAVTAPGDTQTQFLSAAGRYVWPVGVGGFTGVGAFAVSQPLIDSYPLAGTVGIGTFIKAASGATVYVVAADSIKPIASWASLLTLSSTPNPTILTVPDAAIAASKQGLVALTAGSLVRSPNNPTIYVINGLTSKIPVSNFIMTNAAGITGYSTFSDSLIQAYPSSPTNLGFGYVCGTTNYVAAAGSLHPISADLLPRYPISFITFDSYTCAQMQIGSPATSFVRTADGSIYLLDPSGQKRPITSMDRYAALNGPSVGYLQVDGLLAALIPTGPPA